MQPLDLPVCRRTTEYNAVRYLLTALIGLVFSFVFYKLGGHVTTQLGITNVLGALYASTIFLGRLGCFSVLQPPPSPTIWLAVGHCTLVSRS